MAGTKGFYLVGYLLSGALCSEFTIELPERIEAVSGTCVLIPCTFSVPDKYSDQLKNSPWGIWIQHIPQFANTKSTVVFNSSRLHNKLSGEIIGDLVQKNCTTVLDNITEGYSDKYFFRIETLDFQATFPQKHVKITVQGTPPKPNVIKLKELSEGTPVDLKCTAAAPCPKHPPLLVWTPAQENAQHELLDSNKIKSIITFTPSYLHHGKNITCTAEYSLETGRKIKVADIMTLNVRFRPKNTRANISPSGTVSNGSLVTLTCDSLANPPVSQFTWFKITGTGPQNMGFGHTLTFSVNSGDVGWYYCEAQNQVGGQKSGQVKLTIEGVREPIPISVIGGIAGTLGIILAFLLLLLFWRLRKSTKQFTIGKTTCTERQSKDPSLDQCKSVESQQEEVQYAEIELSKQRPKNNGKRGKEDCQGQQTEYAESKDPSLDQCKSVESQQEEVQYAAIELSQQRPKNNGKRGKEDCQGQQTEYAEVQFSQRKGKAQIEDLYAKVKPKSYA